MAADSVDYFLNLAHLMATSQCDAVNDVQPGIGEAWAVSCKKMM